MAGLAACSPPAPVHIGFIGGLTDRNADNGQAGLNGVILAVEQFNREGGVQGRMVELVVHDDAQNRDTAAQATQALVDAQVEGTMQSASVNNKYSVFTVSTSLEMACFFGESPGGTFVMFM